MSSHIKSLLSIFFITVISTANADLPVLPETTPESVLSEINGEILSPYAFAVTLAKLKDPIYTESFKQAELNDSNGEFYKTIEAFLELQKVFPESTYLQWRLAREYWVYAETLAINDKQGRLKYFNIGLDWANKSIALSPECGECFMFKFANLGRISTTNGIVNSMSLAKELSSTIQTAIDLNPKHQDSEWNLTIANAYYASGVLYRMIPDWFWVKWVLGVKGDKQLSLQHIKKASSLAPARVDYQVELGAAYLCLGSIKKNKEFLTLGEEALDKASTMANVMITDDLDKSYIPTLLETPKKACGFSRDGLVDMDDIKKAADARNK